VCVEGERHLPESNPRRATRESAWVWHKCRSEEG
jgi:hypothetical protein